MLATAQLNPRHSLSHTSAILFVFSIFKLFFNWIDIPFLLLHTQNWNPLESPKHTYWFAILYIRYGSFKLLLIHLLFKFLILLPFTLITQMYIPFYFSLLFINFYTSFLFPSYKFSYIFLLQALPLLPHSLFLLFWNCILIILQNT